MSSENSKLNRFYVYTHALPDGSIFYVGKGSRNRKNEMAGRSVMHQSVVKMHGKDAILVNVVEDGMLEEAAFDLEKILISACRSEGLPIVNICSGGEGSAGFKHTDESKERMRQLMIKRFECPEYRERMRLILCNFRDSARFKTEQSARSKELWEDETYRVRMVQIISDSWLDSDKSEQRKLRISQAYTAERRAEQGLRTAAMNKDTQVLDNQRAGQLALWANTEYKQKRCERIKEVYADPEFKKSFSNIMKEVQARSELRAHLDSERRARFENQEYRENNAERLRALSKDADFVKRRGLAIARALADPDVRRRKAEAAQAFARTPEERASRSVRSKAMHQDPEFAKRHKMSVQLGAAKRCGRPFSRLDGRGYPWLIP